MRRAAKPHHVRDFWLYLIWARRRGVIPKDYPLTSRGKIDTIYAFAQFEDRGETTTPKHPRVLRAVLRGKAQLNLQIKEWAQGWFDCGGRWWFDNELKPEFPWMPEWVWEAVERQRWKYAR
jgi:hypothetical protein